MSALVAGQRYLVMTFVGASQAEEWRAIEGAIGHYEVSSAGRVRSIGSRRGRGSALRPHPPIILAHRLNRGGYATVVIHRRTVTVHRLVLTTFTGPCPSGRQCAHLDGVRTNNVLSNLAWCTVSENHLHKRLHGTSRCGERNNKAKFTAAEVAEIRHRASSCDGESHRMIASDLHVARSTVSRIVNRSNWGHV